MARKTTNIKRGRGSVTQKSVKDNAFAYPNRDVDPLRVHIHDPSRAHMASSIGVIDAANCYVSDEVEGVLEEICSTISVVSGLRLNGLIEGGTYTGTYPNITLDTTTTAHINGAEVDLSGETYDFSTGVDPITASPTSVAGTYYLYVETDMASADYKKLVASTQLPSVAAEKVLIARITHDGANYTVETDARFFVRDLDRKIQYTSRQGENIDAWSEGCFATLEAAFLWLGAYRDRTAGVTDEYKATLVVRGTHLLTSKIVADVHQSLVLMGEGSESVIMADAGFTDDCLLELSAGGFSGVSVTFQNMVFRDQNVTASIDQYIKLEAVLAEVYFHKIVTYNGKPLVFIGATSANSVYLTNSVLNGTFTSGILTNFLFIDNVRGVFTGTNKTFIEVNGGNISVLQISNSYFSSHDSDEALYGDGTTPTKNIPTVLVSNCELRISKVNKMGATEAHFDNCTFNVAAFGAKLFDYDFGQLGQRLAVSNCTFTATVTNHYIFWHSITRNFTFLEVSFDSCIESTPSGYFISAYTDILNPVANKVNVDLRVTNCKLKGGIAVSNAFKHVTIANNIIGGSNASYPISRVYLDTVPYANITGNRIFGEIDAGTFASEIPTVNILSGDSLSESVIFKGNQISGNYTQIRVPLSLLEVEGNTFEGFAGTTGRQYAEEYLLDITLDAKPAGYRISGNIFNSGYGGIRVLGSYYKNLEIDNNMFRNIASKDGSTRACIEVFDSAGSGVVCRNFSISRNKAELLGLKAETRLNFTPADQKFNGINVGRISAKGVSSEYVHNFEVSGNIFEEIGLDTGSTEVILVRGNLDNLCLTNNILSMETSSNEKLQYGIMVVPSGNFTNFKIDGNQISRGFADSGGATSLFTYRNSIFLNLASCVEFQNGSISNNNLSWASVCAINIDFGTRDTDQIEVSTIEINNNVVKSYSNQFAPRTDAGAIRIHGDAGDEKAILRGIAICNNVLDYVVNGIVFDVGCSVSQTVSLEDISILDNEVITRAVPPAFAAPVSYNPGGILINRRAPDIVPSAGNPIKGLRVNGNNINAERFAAFQIYDFHLGQHDADSVEVSNNKMVFGATGILMQAAGDALDPNSNSVYSNFDLSNNYMRGENLNSTSTIGINISGILYDLIGIRIHGNDIGLDGDSNSRLTRPITIAAGQGNGAKDSVVEDVLISNNLMKGESGNAVNEEATNLIINQTTTSSFSNIQFIGNTCELRCSLRVVVQTQTTDLDTLVFKDNVTKGRFAFHFFVNGGADTVNMSNFDISNNTHMNFVDGGAASPASYQFIYCVQKVEGLGATLNLRTASFSNNTVDGDSSLDPTKPLGGVGIFGFENLYDIGVKGNDITYLTAPGAYCSFEGFGNGISISNNNMYISNILDSGSGGFSSLNTAVVQFEYGDFASGAIAIPRGADVGFDISNNVIENANLAGAIGAAILVIENPDVGVGDPVGLGGVSVSNNLVTRVIGSHAIYLGFEKIFSFLRGISVESNTLSTGAPSNLATPQGYLLPKSGIWFKGPSDLTNNPKIQNISICKNILHYRASSGTDKGIFVDFNHDRDNDATYTVVNLSVDENTVYNYLSILGSRLVDLNLTCGIRNASCSRNKVRCFNNGDDLYPVNGIVVRHEFRSHGVPFYQKGNLDDGTELFRTTGAGGDTVKVAGYIARTSDITFQVFVDAANTPNNVTATVWRNLSVDGNQINCNSFYAMSSVNNQYPSTQGGDLVVTAVHYEGTLVGGRDAVVVPCYGLSICNNTLRGDELSTSSRTHVGFFVNTFGVYGRWSANDPSPVFTAGEAFGKLTAQGWSIQSNTSSGYAVRFYPGGNIYGRDAQFLASLGSTSLKLEDCGLSTGNNCNGLSGNFIDTYSHLTQGFLPVGPAASTFNVIFSNNTVTRG